MQEHANSAAGPEAATDKRTAPLSSRARLLATAKRLMADEGYQRISTAAIARAAGTSESQLVRYFESKSGLLGAVFEESWTLLNPRIAQVIAGAPTAREATIHILSAMIRMFDRDPDLARLMLLEGRRVRGDTGEVLISKGLQEFSERVAKLIEHGQDDGSFSTDLNPFAVSSALLGAAEAMIRDRLLAKRVPAKRAPFKESHIRLTFESMVSGLAP